MPSKLASKRRRSGEAPGRFGWLRDVPPWLSALAAVTATILTAIGVFGLVNARPPAPTPTDASAAQASPRVTIESVLVGATHVEAQGGFENVDPAREDVLFVGRPAASTADLWVAVEAALSPRSQTGSLQSGSWAAARPAPPPGAVSHVTTAD